MKQFICCLLVFSCLLCLNGCRADNDGKTANFYYIRNSYIYGQADGVMAAEVREIEEFSNEREILLAYLAGPTDPLLVSPFPRETEITEFYYEGDTLYITLCDHISTLAKAKQVLACACIARTAMELTGVKAVYFQTDNTGITRMDPILIDQDSVLLYDDYNAPGTTEP